MTMNAFLYLLAPALLAGPPAAAVAGAPGSVRPVSEGQLPLLSGAGHSTMPGFSADGRCVVFVSQANNLVTNDDVAPFLDVFLRDLAASNTVLVSVNRSGLGGGDADANFPSISSNGQFVAFASAAGNLAPADGNRASDIFVRDLAAGVTRLISVDVHGQAPPNPVAGQNLALSGNPSISADGRRVVFESLATNLVDLPDANGASDVFVRDLQTGRTCCLSVNDQGTATSTGRSDSPSLSSDGRFIAFISTGTDLVPATTLGLGDVFVHDFDEPVTAWASAGLAPLLGNPPSGYRCFDPVMSPGGQAVAYKVTVPGSPNVLVFHHDLRAGTTLCVTSNVHPDTTLQISDDGNHVAYATSFMSDGDASQIYRWDALTQSNRLVSVRADGVGGGGRSSRLPSMSPDGRLIAFTSWSIDLMAGVSNGVSQVFIRDVEAETTQLVSVSTNGLPSVTSHDVNPPVLSPDGRRLAFDGLAADLVEGDLNQASDVFLRDLEAGVTALVSCRHAARPARTGIASAAVNPGAVSAAGSRVLFTGFDNTLVAGDTNFYRDAFVRDLAGGALLPVTVGAAGWAATNPIVADARLSASGRFVVYTVGSQSQGVVARRYGIYRRDLQDQVTTLVYAYTQSLGYPTASPYLLPPTISGDGEWVSLDSADPTVVNYVPGTYGVQQAYVHHMTAQTNQLVSITALPYSAGDGHSFSPVISPDARWVAFKSAAGNLLPNPPGGSFRLYLRDLVAQATVALAGGNDFSSYGFSDDARRLTYAQLTGGVSRVVVHDLLAHTDLFTTNDCAGPSLSAEGRWLAYESPATGVVKQVYARDLQAGQDELISVNLAGSGGGNGPSLMPSISADGRFAVFASKANNLVAGDSNGLQDVFVRNRALGRTLLVSQDLRGTGSGNSASGNPVLAADGRTVVFHSFANDLAPGDYNDRRDVFVLRLAAGDSDGDGLPDDWELAYFDTLDRDGSGDFDGDGHTDREEYLAGTDPTNRGSVLTVLTLQGAGTGSVTVLWAAVPGRVYRVQCKDRLEAAWDDLPGEVVPATTTGSKLDDTAGAAAHRFYRVRVVE